MADKYVTLHPTEDGVLDTSTNIYPNIKASQNVLRDNGTVMQVQEKLESGTNIKAIQVGSSEAEAQSLLGSGSIVIDFLEKLYPVGTIYTCSTNATITTTANGDPICPIERIIGGVWRPIYDTFLFAAKRGTHTTEGDYFPGDEGGSKDAIVPYHTHGNDGLTEGAGAHRHTTEKTWKTNADTTLELTGSFITRACGSSNDTMVRSAKGIVNIRENDPEYSTSGGLAVNLIGASGSPLGDRTYVDARHRHQTNEEPAHRHLIPYAGESGNAVGANMPPYKAIYAWERIS